MSPMLYGAFLLACVGLMLVPGPNVTLIVATSLGGGTRRGLQTVAGTSLGMAAQLGLVALGLAGALAAWGPWLGVLRWAGVAYLVGTGLRELLGREGPAAEAPRDGSGRDVRRGVAAGGRGLLVAVANPKTLLFLGAFLPQFVGRGGDPARQVWMLAAGYLAVALVMDVGWVLAARRVGRWLGRRRGLARRLSGGMLVGCGAGLALVREG